MSGIEFIVQNKASFPGPLANASQVLGEPWKDFLAIKSNEKNVILLESTQGKLKKTPGVQCVCA